MGWENFRWKSLPAGLIIIIELDIPDGPTQNGPITIIR